MASERTIRQQCQATDTSFFKQWGGPTSTSSGRTLDGRIWQEMPERRP
jgi:protein gp37